MGVWCVSFQLFSCTPQHVFILPSMSSGLSCVSHLVMYASCVVTQDSIKYVIHLSFFLLMDVHVVAVFALMNTTVMSTA